MIDRILTACRESEYDFRGTACPDDPLSDRFPELVAYYRLKWAIASVLQPMSILEIGVRYGYSAAAFLAAAPTARYVGIDPPVPSDGDRSGALEYAERLLAAHDVELRRLDGPLIDRLPGGPYDLVHVDGQADGDRSFRTLELALSTGSWVLVDGYLWTRLNFLALNEALFRHAQSVEWLAMVPGYAGELLVKVAEPRAAAARREGSAELRDEYTRAYYLRDCSGWDAYDRPGRSQIENPRLQAVVSLAELGDVGRVLDLGCGRGEVELHLGSRGSRVVGVDYAPEACALARRLVGSDPAARDNVEILCGDVGTVEWSGRFGTVVAADVVEHLAPDELDRVYARIVRHLEPHGRLVVHTNPNRWYYEREYPRRRADAAALGTYLPPDPRTPTESLLHINEHSPVDLRNQLLRHFEHVVVWAGDTGDVRGTLGGPADGLERFPDLFAIASPAPLDELELRDTVGMEVIGPEEARGLNLTVLEHRETNSGTWQIRVRLENDGQVSLNSNLPFPIQLGHEWIDQATGEIAYGDGRARLFPWLRPGAREQYEVHVTSPARPGRHRLRVCLVQEFVRWFDAGDDGLSAELDLDVS